MNPKARTENARMLAQLLGISEETAAERLNISIAVTAAADPLAQELGGHLAALLARTVTNVVLEGSEVTAVKSEVVVGTAKPRFKAPTTYVQCGVEKVHISARSFQETVAAKVHPVGLLLAACYACGIALKDAVGEGLPFPVSREHELDLVALVGDDLPLLYEDVDFGEAYVAGAGAIGNGFVYGLACFLARGRLHICDDDRVSGGNLQRCLFFSEEDIGKWKASHLCARLRELLPGVEAIPHDVRLQNVPGRVAGPWLGRLIVGVDSPRARRVLQSEISGEVFDASTTGVTEIVLHFHRQPTDLACLGCVYPENPVEDARERHVAEMLGVTVADVRQSRVSPPPPPASASGIRKCGRRRWSARPTTPCSSSCARPAS